MTSAHITCRCKNAMGSRRRPTTLGSGTDDAHHRVVACYPHDRISFLIIQLASGTRRLYYEVAESLSKPKFLTGFLLPVKKKSPEPPQPWKEYLTHKHKDDPEVLSFLSHVQTWEDVQVASMYRPKWQWKHISKALRDLLDMSLGLVWSDGPDPAYGAGSIPTISVVDLIPFLDSCVSPEETYLQAYHQNRRRLVKEDDAALEKAREEAMKHTRTFFPNYDGRPKTEEEKKGEFFQWLRYNLSPPTDAHSTAYRRRRKRDHRKRTHTCYRCGEMFVR